jgi:hypothetical protein
LEYIRQARRTLYSRFKEHKQAIKGSKQNSGYAQHILDTGHACGTITDTMEQVHIARYVSGSQHKYRNGKVKCTATPIYNICCALLKNGRKKTTSKKV